MGWGVSTLTLGGLSWLSRGDAFAELVRLEGSEWIPEGGVRGCVGAGSAADQEKGAADHQARERAQARSGGEAAVGKETNSDSEIWNPEQQK